MLALAQTRRPQESPVRFPRFSESIDEVVESFLGVLVHRTPISQHLTNSWT